MTEASLAIADLFLTAATQSPFNELAARLTRRPFRRRDLALGHSGRAPTGDSAVA